LGYNNAMGRLRALVLVGGLAALLAVTGCGSRADRSELAAASEEQGGGSGDSGGGGGGSGEQTTTTQDPAEAEEQITEVIEGGINGQNLSDLEANIDKVENGDDPKIRATLEGIAANPTFATVTATVKRVEPLDDAGCSGAGVDPPCAQVTFDISLNGAVALPDYRGYVVQRNGKWQLSKVSLCGLVSLDPSIPQCA
jgi:hypothetical protein